MTKTYSDAIAQWRAFQSAANRNLVNILNALLVDNDIYCGHDACEGDFVANQREKFGLVTLTRIRNLADMRRFLKGLHLKNNPVIIKPNWVFQKIGGFTDCETLRMLLEALDGKVIVTEGYQIARVTDEHNRGVRFTVDGKGVDWEWLRESQDAWRWLQRQPNWEWFKSGGHWDHMRKQDKRFLDERGFTDLFNEHGVEYINVTEEVWQERRANPQEIENAVVSKFSPVSEKKLYGCVPQKLYDLRGATFISFAKLKNMYSQGTFPSFTMKNFFGLIPDPYRSWWHQWLTQSIIDIIKIYSSLFNVHGICEGIRYACLYHPNDKSGEEDTKYRVYENLGLLASGQHLVSVDAVLCGLVGVDPKTLSYLNLGEKTFGAYDRSCVEAAKAAASRWLPQ